MFKCDHKWSSYQKIRQQKKNIFFVIASTRYQHTQRLCFVFNSISLILTYSKIIYCLQQHLSTTNILKDYVLSSTAPTHY